MNRKGFLFILRMAVAAIAFCSCDAGFWDGSSSEGGNVSYDANGADYGTPPSSHSSNISVQENIGNLEKNGYCFGCWNTARDGSGRDYFPGASSPDGGVLYAKWEAIFNYRSSSLGVSSAKNSSSSGRTYLHITGVTAKGKTLAELKVTTTIDGCDVTGIDGGAFKSCCNVKSITLSENIRSIGRGAFAGCDNLKNLIMLGTEPPDMEIGALDSCFATIYVPPGAKEKYNSIAEWRTANIVEYYTVTFDSQNATIAAYPYNIKVIYPDITIGKFPSQPIKDGYNFDGWYTGPDGTGVLFTENTAVSQDMTVYAKWKKNAQVSGVKLSFTIISFSDARIPSHLFDNETPDEKASYFYKATPRWTSDIRSVAGATVDYVQIPYSYSVNTLKADMGHFASGIWDFSVKVVSNNGVTLYSKNLNGYNVQSDDDIEFDLEKSYSGTGILRINANMQTYDMNQEGNKLILSYKYSGVPEIYTEVFNDASCISKEFSLPPGFYFVSLEQQDKYSTVIGRKTGYIEVFADETSVLNGIVEKGKWISESYSSIVSNKFPFEERKKLGIIFEATRGVIQWKFTALKTVDSEDIIKYSWYVNDKIMQTGSSNVFVYINPFIDFGNYKVSLLVIDSTKNQKEIEFAIP